MQLPVQNYTIHAGRSSSEHFVGHIKLTAKQASTNQMDIFVTFVEDKFYSGQLGQAFGSNILGVTLPASDLHQFYELLRHADEVKAEWDLDSTGTLITLFRIMADHNFD